MKYSVYGTVLNNVNTVEEAVKSIFSPEYDIVIVDSYSTDGTYEKLLELEKDYNLRVFRLKCSRGMGRDYALRHCSEGSRTAYADFDVKYNGNFHKLMLSDIDRLYVYSDQQAFFVNKERAVDNGSWKDLNSMEDVEFFLRNGVKASIPAVIGDNYRSTSDEEKRYAVGLNYFRRRAEIRVDTIRGQGLRLSDIAPSIISSHGLMGTLNVPLYVLASIKGVYRFDKKANNITLLTKVALSTLRDPAEFGIADNDVCVPVWQPIGKALSDEYVKKKLDYKFKFSFERTIRPRLGGAGNYVIYVKTTDAIGHLEHMRIGRYGPVHLVGAFGPDMPKGGTGFRQ